MLDLTKYSVDNLEEFKVACLKDLEIDHHEKSDVLFKMVLEKFVPDDKEHLLINIYSAMSAVANVIKKENKA